METTPALGLGNSADPDHPAAAAPVPALAPPLVSHDALLIPSLAPSLAGPLDPALAVPQAAWQPGESAGRVGGGDIEIDLGESPIVDLDLAPSTNPEGTAPPPPAPAPAAAKLAFKLKPLSYERRPTPAPPPELVAIAREAASQGGPNASLAGGESGDGGKQSSSNGPLPLRKHGA